MKKKAKKDVVYGLGVGEQEFFDGLSGKSDVVVLNPRQSVAQPLSKSVRNLLNSDNEITRVSFEVDPINTDQYSGLHKRKLRGVPDEHAKLIAREDSLVSNIVRCRQNHISQLGRPRQTRFSKGYEIVANTGVLDKMDESQKKAFNARIERAVKLFYTCGNTENVKHQHQKTFSEYLASLTRSGVVCGRFATEIVRTESIDGLSNNRPFHHFVAVDSGTIFAANKDEGGLQSIRDEAFTLLKQLTGNNGLTRETIPSEPYDWVQVINGTDRQVFSSDDMKCYNLYAVPDIECGGYPVTPIDTVVTAVTTHLNITTHNKMYFQSGRATRGMLIIKSEDVSPANLNQIKQQFNASINNASNSWRMPVFGVPPDGDIEWRPIDVGSGRDMEFQYLTDMNAREIMTAFMMSPDELPGWTYLSRGTASQALSESNNEFKLEASRDVGIRPLLMAIEDYINDSIFPIIDLELSKQARFSFVGLDASTPQTEAAELSSAAGLWMTFDDLLEKVEKKPVGASLGGTIPLNGVYSQILDKLFTVGEQLEKFCGVKDASKDPNLNYRANPFWFQQQNLLLEQAQMKMQAEQAQQPPQGPQDPNGGQPDQQDPQQDQQPDQQQAQPSGSDKLGKAIDQAYELLNKSQDTTLPPAQRKILLQQKKVVDSFKSSFERDSKEAIEEILAVAKTIRENA